MQNVNVFPSSSPSCAHLGDEEQGQGWGEGGVAWGRFEFPLIFAAVVFGNAERCVQLPFVDLICPGTGSQMKGLAKTLL